MVDAASIIKFATALERIKDGTWTSNVTSLYEIKKYENIFRFNRDNLHAGKFDMHVSLNLEEEIKKSEPLGFGKGTEYVMDTFVRFAFGRKIERDDNLINVMSKIMRIIQGQLEVAKHFSHRIELGYSAKVAFYTPGGHFKEHRDTPINKYHIANVVVLFPYEFEGGELIVGGKSVFTKVSPNKFQYVVFHPSNLHEVTPVTSGIRMTMQIPVFAYIDEPNSDRKHDDSDDDDPDKDDPEKDYFDDDDPEKDESEKDESEKDESEKDDPIDEAAQYFIDSVIEYNSKFDRKFGIVLSNLYVKDQILDYPDSYFVEYLHKIGYSTERTEVVLIVSETPESGVIHRKLCPILDKYGDVHFYCKDDPAESIFSHTGAEYIGNDAMDAESIYCITAVIAMKNE